MSESSLAVILNSNAFASRSLISHRKGCERLGLLQVVNSAGVEPTISRFEGEPHPRDLPAVHKWALAVVIVSRICSTFRITNLNLTHPWLASFSCDSVIHFIFYIFFLLGDFFDHPSCSFPPLILVILDRDRDNESEFQEILGHPVNQIPGGLEPSSSSGFEQSHTVHRTAPISAFGYQSRISRRVKGKGVDRESVDLGPEVSSSQSVHLRSTPLPSSFFKQDLGHAVSTTTPSSFAQTQLSIGPSEDSKAGSPSTDNSLTSTLVERQSTTPVQSRPPTAMSQRAFEDDDLGTPLHSAQTRMPSVQDPSLAHQSYEHSQPLPSQSYQPLPSQPLPSHEHVYHTAMPGPSSSRRVPGTYTLPEDRMDSPPSTTTIPPRFAARRPVRIKPQGRFELFNGIDVERFIRRWESVGEIQEASDLNLVQLNRTLPGEALNHQMSGETLNTQPSATTKNINPSAKKSNINLLAQALDEASVRNDNEKLPPPPLFLLFISQISVKFLVIIFFLSSFVGPRILINDHLIGFSLVVAMFVLVSVLTMTRSGLLFLLGARILLLVLPTSVLLVTVSRNIVKPGSVSMGMLVEESPLLPFCSHC